MDSAVADRFEAGRARPASLAYRLLGSAADAEDIVQDAYLRRHAADRERIEVPQAWLTKVVTNLCLDRLRSAPVRRERAAGVWMPEPLLDGDPMLGPPFHRGEPLHQGLREAFSYRSSSVSRSGS